MDRRFSKPVSAIRFRAGVQAKLKFPDLFRLGLRKPRDRADQRMLEVFGKERVNPNGE